MAGRGGAEEESCGARFQNRSATVDGMKIKSSRRKLFESSHILPVQGGHW
jgi:hypothetical protein